MIFNPFDQFKIISFLYLCFPVFSLFVTNTNVISTFVIIWNYLNYIYLSLFRKKKSDKNILLYIYTSLYTFIINIVNSYLLKEGKIYFPFFLYVFMFICTHNLIGILPFAFTTTSHLSVTFTLSFMVWYGCVIIGFQENGLRFFSLVFPGGIPFALSPFLTGIETISYVFRSVSLALRLFANIVAGHILLETLALSIQKMLYPAFVTLKTIIISIIPFIMSSILMMFECIVALLQGYIFIVLSCIYLKDTYSAQNH